MGEVVPTDLDKIDLLPIIAGVQGKYCPGCDNREAGIRMIPPDGKGYSGVMIVGDSGWEWEAREGRPFAGPAGQFLDKHIFRRLGVTRDAFTITNSVWCKAPRLNFFDYAGPEATAITEHCRPYLDELIEKVKPKVIIPMGNVALRRICNVSGIKPISVMCRYAIRHPSSTHLPSILCDAG